MATDYESRLQILPKALGVFGIGCGVITMVVSVGRLSGGRSLLYVYETFLTPFLG